MSEMRVDVQGLQAWSAQCAAVAGKLAAASMALPGSPTGQATATAVSTGQTLVEGTTALMATRVRGTGTSAAGSAEAYAVNDDESAQRLAAVWPGPAAT